MFENTIVTNQKDVMELIYRHNIHKAITVKAIQNLSFKGNQSAWNIRNSGYTDAITEELYSNVLLLLCEAVTNGLCTIEVWQEHEEEKAKLIFTDTDEEENSDTFLSVYRSVSNYLYSQRQREYKWLHIEEIDEDGEATIYSINDKKALSVRSNLHTIEEMDIIQQVKSKLKDKDVATLDLLLKGFSYREIAQSQNATLKAVRCSVDRIRKAYPREEIKRISEVLPTYTDTTKHTYLEFTEVVPDLPEHLQGTYNLYLTLQSNLVEEVKTSEEIEIIPDTIRVYPYVPSEKGLSDSEKKRKINTSIPKIRKPISQELSSYRPMLLIDKLSQPSKIIEKPKAKVIVKVKKGE